MTDIKINATTFANFCAAVGTKKITVVREAMPKYRKGYKQGPDYWKPFRDEFASVLRRGATATELKNVLSSPHVKPEQEENYGRAIDGAIKWIGRKKIALSPAHAKEWRNGDLVVKVQPEFLADINGVPHVIKLWLKAGDKLTKQRADILLHLLDTTHGKGAGSTATVAVLDVIQGKMFVQTRKMANIAALMVAEATAFEQLWKAI
jgi:hypothetical protein